MNALATTGVTARKRGKFMAAKATHRTGPGHEKFSPICEYETTDSTDDTDDENVPLARHSSGLNRGAQIASPSISVQSVSSVVFHFGFYVQSGFAKNPVFLRVIDGAQILTLSIFPLSSNEPNPTQPLAKVLSSATMI